MARGYEVDDSRFPLVIVRYRGLLDDEAFEAYLQRLQEVRSRGPNVAVLDATHAGYLPASQRRRQAEWLREHAGMMRDNSLGTAFVIPSTLIRGVLTAILWIVPMPGPHVVVETHEQGEEWARARLHAAGLEARDAG
jgi:hypothetical protein